jgi:hypothetical protein
MSMKGGMQHADGGPAQDEEAAHSRVGSYRITSSVWKRNDGESEAQRLGSLQVDDQIEARRVLHG